MFKPQKAALKALLPSFINNSKGIILAGGAITSIFMRKDINDVDLFCKDQGAFDSVCDELLKNNFDVIFVSNKAVTFNRQESQDTTIQVMHYSFFKDSNEVFKHFDFTACMGSFDFDTDEFIMDDDFMVTLASRNTSIHLGTRYPLITMLRIKKYEEKGFSIPRTKKLSLMLKVASLNINTWEELEDQIGGFYGGLHLSDEEKKEPFSMDVAINKAHKFTEVKNSYEKKIYSSVAEFIKETNVTHKGIISHLEENSLIDEEIDF